MAHVVGLARRGPAFLDALLEVWARGDAAWPIDHRLPPAAVTELQRIVAPHSIIDDDGEHAVPGGRVTADGDALVVTTSGTTGTPKGVVLTHQAVAAAGRATSAALDVDPAADHWLCCLPVAHVAGLGVITRALVAGCALTIHDGFDAAAVMASGASLVSLVPTTLGRVQAERFRVILLGGAAPPGQLPPNVVTTWGMTETFGGVVYDGWSLPGTEVEVRDGVLALRTPSLGRCYRTAEGEAPLVDGDGWFLTGDAGTMDGDGMVAVHGRVDDVINTGGEKVWPDRVEAVVRTVPGVAEVTVVGRPDPEWGERVVAAIVPTAGQAPPTLAAVRAAADGVLSPWEVPKELVVVASLPRTALGKIQRREVRRGLSG